MDLQMATLYFAGCLVLLAGHDKNIRTKIEKHPCFSSPVAMHPLIAAKLCKHTEDACPTFAYHKLFQI